MNRLRDTDNPLEFSNSFEPIRKFGRCVTSQDDPHVKDADLILSLYDAIDAPTTYWNSIDVLKRRRSPDASEADIVAHADRINRFLLDRLSKDFDSAVLDTSLSAQFDSQARMVSSGTAFLESYGQGQIDTLHDLPLLASDYPQLDAYLAKTAERNVVVTLHEAASGKRQIALITRDSETKGHHLEVLNTSLPDHARVPLAEYFAVSEVEQEVLRLIVEGKSIEEIAAARERSAETIRTHVKSLTRKLGVNSQVELVSRVLAIPSMQDIPRSRHEALNGTVHDGVQYFLVGSPLRPTVLYFQSVTDGPIVTDALCRTLQDAGYSMLSVSRPGAAKTSVHKANYCKEAAANINRIVTHLGLEVHGLMAVGTGLPHALIYAQTYDNKISVLGLNPMPPMTSQTVIDGLPGRWRSFGMLAFRMPYLIYTVMLLAGRLFARDPTQHALKIVQDEVDQDLPEQAYEDVVATVRHNQSLNAEHSARHFFEEAKLIASAWDATARAGCPEGQITLVQGQGGFTIPADHIQNLADQLPNATVRLHDTNVDPIHLVAPQIALDEIKCAFVRRPPAPPPTLAESSPSRL